MKQAAELTANATGRGASLRCILLPLKDMTLLVPHGLVDEILPFAVVEKFQHADRMIIGDLLWRKEKLPLVSFELLQEQTAPTVKRRTRVAVFSSITDNSKFKSYSLVLSGMPKMIVINDTDIQEEGMNDLPKYTVRRVRVEKTIAYIPDISAIEQVLGDVESID